MLVFCCMCFVLCSVFVFECWVVLFGCCLLVVFGGCFFCFVGCSDDVLHVLCVWLWLCAFVGVV